MSAERIAAAGAPPVTPSLGRQPHPFYEGEFLDAVRSAGNSAPAALGKPSGSIAEAHPFYEFELAPSAFPGVDSAPKQAVANATVQHPFYEGETLDGDAGTKAFGEDGLELSDLIDVINPLQHIPVLSSIYRSLTGDEIAPAARLAGGALFGGPVGLASAFVGGVIEDSTDQTIGDVVVAAFSGDGDEAPVEQLAALSPAAGMTPATAATTTVSPASALAPQIASAIADVQAPSSVKTAAAVPNLQSVFSQTTPSPLSVARDLLESPASAYATPTAASTKAVITADENAQRPSEMPEAVAAVLAARSQVPRAGAINGLSAYRQSPGGHQPAGTNMPQAGFRASRQPGSDAATKLDQPDLSAAVMPGKRGAPPPRTTITTNARRQSTAASVVPNSMVPKAMMTALEKYEAMMQSRNSADGDLTM